MQMYYITGENFNLIYMETCIHMVNQYQYLYINMWSNSKMYHCGNICTAYPYFACNKSETVNLI